MESILANSHGDGLVQPPYLDVLEFLAVATLPPTHKPQDRSKAPGRLQSTVADMSMCAAYLCRFVTELTPYLGISTHQWQAGWLSILVEDEEGGGPLCRLTSHYRRVEEEGGMSDLTVHWQE